MKNTGEKIKDILKGRQVKDQEKLHKQQKYYERLTKKGIAKKQTYNLKAISAI